MNSGVEHSASRKLHLFQELKSTVERILSQHSYDVWSVHGGLQSLVLSLDAIFQHGSKPHVGILGTVVDYWLFIRGLRWLDPTLAPSIDRLSKQSAASPSKPLSQFTSTRLPALLTHGQQWIEKSLKDRSISRQIKALISDSNHVHEHYFDWAYLLDEAFTSATLTCVTALEQNSSALLANIPSSLFARRQSPTKNPVRVHNALTTPSADEIFSFTDFNPVGSFEKRSLNMQTSTVDELEPEGDPLSASIKAANIAERKVKKVDIKRSTRAQVASNYSNYSVSSPSRLYDVVNTNSSSSSEVPSPNAHFEADDKSSIYATDKNRQTIARKPLFNDSSDSEDSNTNDLAFLLSPMTDLPVESIQGSSYYFTMENNCHLIQSPITQLSETAGCPYVEKASFQPQETVKTLLPDLVISAEVSRANNLETSTITSSSSTVVCVSDDIASDDGLDFDKHKSISIEKQAKKISPKTLHRRCRSDQYNGLGAKIPNLTFNDVNKHVIPSTSFPQSEQVQRSATIDNLFPKPRSLMNYLKNQDLTTCADIDKENAHFDFSEMLIGAIEQMKCRLQEHHMSTIDAEKSIADDSDLLQEENSLSLDEAVLSLSESYHSPLGSPPSESVISSCGSSSGVPTDAESAIAISSTQTRQKRATTLNGNSSRRESLRTAESIAIGLLQTVSGQQYVTENEMDWLISEEDVPQKLLPLPKSTAIDPDSSPDPGIRLRGNQDWAPPRPQIIFKAPTRVKLKVARMRQNSRCAGCGTYVEKEFMKRFRYCEYTGKYFCTCCHDNKLAILPAKVLRKFDFSKCKVSNFSYDWLSKINCEPLFNIIDINSSLYTKFKAMSSIRDLRVKMASLYKYLQVCRFANASSEDFPDGFTKKISSAFLPHLLESDPHLYSLHDLEGVKNGELLEELKNAVEEASCHVTSCELCRMKGFLCEVCRSEEIIFPHQAFTSTCNSCNSCFHIKCFISSSCPKCARLRKRKAALRQISEEPNAKDD